jgi:hypothetical protein
MLFILFFYIKSYSQYDSYSQFYNSELTLNPALTGMIPATWQVKDIYQYQTNNNNPGINTNSLFAEYKIPLFKIHKKDYGLNIKESSNSTLGIGILDQRSISNKKINFRSNYLSIALNTKMLSDLYFSFGIQPGIIELKDKDIYDMNFGFLFGYKEMWCQKQDQIFKFQIGASIYHISQSYHSNEDSVFTPSRKIQAHTSALTDISKKIGLVTNVHYVFKKDNYFNLGTTMLIKSHHTNYDRIRFGIHYKTTNHLVLSAGIRTFGNQINTHLFDICISYDMMICAKSDYKEAIEISILFSPLKKCWEINRCGNKLEN